MFFATVFCFHCAVAMPANYTNAAEQGRLVRNGGGGGPNDGRTRHIDPRSGFRRARCACARHGTHTRARRSRQPSTRARETGNGVTRAGGGLAPDGEKREADA